MRIVSCFYSLSAKDYFEGMPLEFVNYFVEQLEREENVTIVDIRATVEHVADKDWYDIKAYITYKKNASIDSVKEYVNE